MVHPPVSSRPRVRRTALAALAVLSLVVAVTGCDLTRPTGDGPLRFRDEVFAAVDVTTNVTYGTAVDQDGVTKTLLFDLYEPVGDTFGERPLYILAHGGSFSGGNKTSAEIVDQANYFAKRGYVVASINYRLSRYGCTRVDAACVTAIFQATADGQSAVRFFRAHADDYGIDAARIAFGGTSAGGIIAGNVGSGYEVTSNGNWPDQPSNVAAIISLSGAALPASAIGSGDAAMLFFHGSSDTVVPYDWAVQSHEAAQAAGVPSYLTTWSGAGHVPYVQNRTQYLDLSTNFLFHRLTVRAML